MLATANTGVIGRGLGKNAGEWTGRVEISVEEIPGSKRSTYVGPSDNQEGTSSVNPQLRSRA